MLMKQISAFGIQIHPLTKHDFLFIISEGIKKKKQIVQSGVNASSIVELVHCIDLKAAYNECDLVNIDGMSLVWALRFFGYKVPERVACPDLAESVLQLAEINKYGVFFLGASEENLLLAISNISIDYPNLKISGYRNGYFAPEDENQIANMIDQSEAHILFLGLPSPQKELFVKAHKDKLHVNYFLGVGGFFDILSGSKKRAPIWMQNSGLEWFYRFIQEPFRLLDRYFIGNLKFIRIVVLEKVKQGKSLPFL